jgi:hypothetical protein
VLFRSVSASSHGIQQEWIWRSQVHWMVNDHFHAPATSIPREIASLHALQGQFRRWWWKGNWTPVENWSTTEHPFYDLCYHSYGQERSDIFRVYYGTHYLERLFKGSKIASQIAASFLTRAKMLSWHYHVEVYLGANLFLTGCIHFLL